MTSKNNKLNEKILVILGPTSSGKTSIAIDLAEYFGNTTILSADSRQICRHMDIGTGKVPLGEKRVIVRGNNKWNISGIEIGGYDLIEPDQFFSGYEFAKFGLDYVREQKSLGNTTIIAGGTGFYIDLMTGRSYPSNIEPNFKLRKDLEAMNLEELGKKLMSLNKDEHEKVDRKNKVRLIRAIEKFSGKGVYGTPLPYLNETDYVFIGLRASNKFLYERVDFWADTIWHGGLLEEVRSLIDMGFENSFRMQGLIYGNALSYVKGEISEDDALQKIKFDLHAYIRRQLTWFKRNEGITWFDIEGSSKKKIMDKILAKFTR